MHTAEEYQKYTEDWASSFMKRAFHPAVFDGIDGDHRDFLKADFFLSIFWGKWKGRWSIKRTFAYVQKFGSQWSGCS